jgi:polar amino acid transport system substrate-binding protein
MPMRAPHRQTDLPRRLEALLIWSCLALLAGCSRSGSGASTAAAGSATPRRQIVVAVIYSAPPALYRNESGHLSGFMYDIEVELSRRLGVPFDFQPTSFENIITGVQSGKFDLGNGVDATPLRQNVVDIVPLYRGSYSFLTLEDGGKHLAGQMDALCGLTVASVAGGSDGPTIDAQSRQCQSSGKPAIQLLRFDSTVNALLALKSHKADAMTAFAWYPPLPGTQLTGPTFSEVQTGVALKKGSPLAAQLVAGINSMIEDGSYARILAGYKVPTVALSSASLNPAHQQDSHQ